MYKLTSISIIVVALWMGFIQLPAFAGKQGLPAGRVGGGTR